MNCARHHCSLIFVLIAIAATSLAQGSDSLLPPADRDPFVGKWKANQEKSRPKLDRKNATYTRTVARDGDAWILSSEMKNFPGSEHHYRILCDGRLHPAPHGVQVARRYKSPSLIEGETVIPGQGTKYWREEVSQDGQQMSITSYKGRKRLKVVSVWILDRVH